jgi:hypothetical protein
MRKERPRFYCGRVESNDGDRHLDISECTEGLKERIPFQTVEYRLKTCNRRTPTDPAWGTLAGVPVRICQRLQCYILKHGNNAHSFGMSYCGGYCKSLGQRNIAQTTVPPRQNRRRMREDLGPQGLIDGNCSCARELRCIVAHIGPSFR